MSAASGGSDVPTPSTPQEIPLTPSPDAPREAPLTPSPAAPGEGGGEGSRSDRGAPDERGKRSTLTQPSPGVRGEGEGAALVPEPLLYSAGRIICRIYTTLNHDLKVYGVEHVPPRGGVIIASTHQSNLDPVLIGVRLRRPLSFLAKSELFANPYFGWLIRNLNAFPVRQGEGDVGALRETIRRLQEGHALNIFPEGTRSRDGETLAIEPGIALIVRRVGVPVVPAVIDGSFDAMPPGAKTIHPAPIRVAFGPAMDLAGLKTPQILRTIGTTLRRMLDDLRRREPVLQEARRRRHAR